MKLPARPMVQAIAWWVAAELVRRHPSELRVIETHPGGGQYDCISVHETSTEPRLIAHLNLTGHLTPGSWFTSDKRRPSWTSIATSTDRRARVIEALERSEGLRPPTSTPSATPVSLSIRAIAAFMERSSLATQSRWEWANGYYDSSLGCEVREDCFQALPLVARHRESNNEPVILNVKEYRYWFLLNQSIDDSSPVLAIDQASGIAWDLEHSYDLMGMYKQRNRSLDRLVSDVFPPAF